MRFSLSKRFLAFFSVFGLITAVLGGSVYLSLTSLERSSHQVQQLYDFSLQVKELEALNADYSIDSSGSREERLDRILDKAEALVHTLLEYRSLSVLDLEPLVKNLDYYLHYYRSAGYELLVQGERAELLRREANALFPRILDVLAVLHGEKGFRVLQFFASQKALADEFLQTGQLATLARIRKLEQELPAIINDPQLQEMESQFVVTLEQHYLASLAIRDRSDFLGKTSQRFLEIVSTSVEQLHLDSGRKQKVLRQRIIALVLLSMLLAIVFWWAMTKRLQAFLGNMEHAIDEIKAGHYDYPLPTLSEDELGDLTLFLKELSLSLEREICERQRSETEREQLQGQLFQAQRLESVAMLAGGVAHDFNNILTSIIGYSELAIGQGGPDSRTRRYLEIILQAGRRAEKLTRQLLAFSRTQVLETRVIDLNALIKDLVGMLDRLLGDQVILDLALDESIGNLRADPVQIEQVLMNLAVNARDAMPEGGTLTIATRCVHGDGGLGGNGNDQRSGDFVRLEVRDTGQGMSEELRQRIFDPFFTTKEKGRGTGLGLSMVYGIVEKHGGCLTVESKPGQGSVFLVDFPVCPESVPVDEEGDAKSSVGLGGTETILVVDDDPTVRVFLKECLEGSGYRVLVAEHGADALQVIERYGGDIDLVLTDATMPVMSGQLLIESVRQQWPTIRTILMSGHVEPGSGDGQVFSGDVLFVQKPVLPGRLLAILRQELDRVQ